MGTWNTLRTWGFGLVALLGLAACGGGDGGGEPAFRDPLTSECGGLGTAVQALTSGDYCAAEVLDWAYDAATGELSLLHQRTSLNCCGEHEVAASWSGDQIVVSATDDTLNGGRCGCMCVFDFGLTVVNVPAGGTAQALVWRLQIEEEGGPRDVVVFDGMLDLTQGAGTIVLNDQPAVMGCDSTTP